MPPWILAIDFGTSYTVAAVKVGERAPEVIEIAGERRVPSVVLVETDGSVVVGRAADDLSVTNPAGTLRALKNRLGDQSPVILAGRPYQIVALVAALLADVYGHVLRQMGEPPTEVRLTHPATWNQPRVARLVEAATKAGLPDPQLVPEPVAAALSYASEVGIAAGQFVAVYDLGGGTFDTAVVTQRAGQFVIVGRPSGDQHIGGELFDELIVEHIGALLPDEAWDAIQTGQDSLWQQVGSALRNEVRKAKEALSLHPYVNVVVPLPTGLWQTRLDRATVDALMRPAIEETVVLLRRCVEEAGLGAGEQISPSLAGISLAGGSSRSPIVEEMVAAAFAGIPVSRRGDPKAAVAAGAARAVSAQPEPRPQDAITQPASPRTAPEGLRLAPPVSVPPAPPAPPGPPAAPAPAPVAARQPAPGRRRSRRVFAAVFALLAVGIAIGVVFALGNSPEGTSATTVSVSVTSQVTVPTTAPATLPVTAPAPTTAPATAPATTAASIPPDSTTTTAPAPPPGTRLLTLTGNDGQVPSAVFSADGSMVAGASLDRTVSVWDTSSGALVHRLLGHTDEVYSVAFSPDSSRLVSAGADRTARVWDVASGALLFTLSGHTDVVFEASYSSDGARIVTASADGTARVWDAATGALLSTLVGHREAVYSAAFSPDGSRIATGGRDDAVRLWDASNGAPIAELLGHTADVQTVAFSPDGNEVVSASDDSTVRVWSVAAGTLLHTLQGHVGKVWSAAFSPDGTLIVSGGMDGSVRLWRAADGGELAVHTAHSKDVYGVEFSPDGGLVVAASFDGTASVWDVASGALSATLAGHTDAVFTAHFDRDGRRIVTASADGTARVWVA